MSRALFAMYDLMDDAGFRQEERGRHDQGARAKVTSGKHLDRVADVIRDDLISRGFDASDVLVGGRSLTLPGWFRMAKDWDMLAFDGGDLLAAVELKSINSSFGNNANNRTEEALGSAVDAAHAIKGWLIPSENVMPALAYVLVIRDCDGSRRTASNRKPVYPADDVFTDTSYLDRLTIMCRRMLEERIYQAVWVVYVDTEQRVITEPDPALSYDRFIEILASQLRISRA